MPKLKPALSAADPLAGLSESERAKQVGKIIDGLKAADEGRFVSDADIEAIIRKFEMNA